MSASSTDFTPHRAAIDMLNEIHERMGVELVYRLKLERLAVDKIAEKHIAMAYEAGHGTPPTAPAQQPLTCTWTLDDEESGTWASSCGELWSFIDGGPDENRVSYCHHCGGKVVIGTKQ